MNTNIATREEAKREESRVNTGFWEFIGYTTLLLAVFGQITVGKWYLLAQSAYMITNLLSIVRDYALRLPRANKVKDFTFAGITLALIIMKLW